ncbi:MAG: 2-C-methyl-D-erythritol 4-phosphate cytidylyltransferase [candidate division Zixibacteria bacterium]|nr:2-C-methyl-D-erythritol 4-phosphate cytidylyltransferase [candidate division Zixibacteria bacterium]
MPTAPTIGVIIAAAGSGTRLGPGAPKQWRRFRDGTTPVERSLRSFCESALTSSGQKHQVTWIALVADSIHMDEARRLAIADAAPAQIIAGGPTRTESVRNALRKLPDDIEIVAIHDAVRPLWPRRLWDRLIEAARGADGAILAAPVADTLKRPQGESLSTVDRRDLWMAQTPQVFHVPILKEAHQRAQEDGVGGTDDAELVERIGGRIAIVESTKANVKITNPEDWDMAQLKVEAEGSSTSFRMGIGFDAHRLGGDRPLVLGGVRLADGGGLIAHSDGDVLLHAICDALLGAAALGDIGRHFPPDDPKYTGVDSRFLLRRTVDILAAAGYRPSQIDSVIMAEAPRIAPHVSVMRAHIAADLDLPESSVSVKATTMEQMGFVGRKEGIAAQAVAVILKQDIEGTR